MVAASVSTMCNRHGQMGGWHSATGSQSATGAADDCAQSDCADCADAATGGEGSWLCVIVFVIPTPS